MISVLGGLQGLVGWFMVSPASSEQAPDGTGCVIHLSIALSLYAAILWVAMTEWVPYPDRRYPDASACAG